MTDKPTTLGVVIPTLNEERTIASLLDDLAKQKDIQLEIVVCDGGSTDNTQRVVQDLAKKQRIPVKWVHADTGRGRQMNHGMLHTRADDLLFLHADTRIYNRRLLANAAIAIAQQRALKPSKLIAGHFALTFYRTLDRHGGAYFFYESKTHLNRRDCINGDQGYWISRQHFEQIGRFDESLPFMEDARFALRVFDKGKWMTLPGVIETSARRFEIEGFTRRQLINSFLCNFNAMGEDHFARAALDVYRVQHAGKPLPLYPFMRIAHQQIFKDGIARALTRIYKTGGYIADNIWQLAYALDCRRNRKRCLVSGEGPGNYLRYYDKKLAWMLTSPPARLIVALATVVWFYTMFIGLKVNFNTSG